MPYVEAFQFKNLLNFTQNFIEYEPPKDALLTDISQTSRTSTDIE